MFHDVVIEREKKSDREKEKSVRESRKKREREKDIKRK
jgi:hypothetical protein